MSLVGIRIVEYLYHGDDMELPSLIRVFVDGDNGRVIDLINTIWDAAPVLEWLADNSLSISREVLPKALENHGKSIAEKVRIALDLVDPFDDVTVDAIHDYLRRHSLVVAFSGTSVPDIIIGIGSEGGEISCFEPGAECRYGVDLSEFPVAIEKIAISISGRRSRLNTRPS